MRTLCVLTLLAIGTAVPAARADAIPPPVELTEIQIALIGIWRQEGCVWPEGLGHSCASRVIAFGNESFSDLGFAGMAASNEFGSSASDGTWTAVRTDATHITVTVLRKDGAPQELAITFESENAILVKDTTWARYPEIRLTRTGSPVRPRDGN